MEHEKSEFIEKFNLPENLLAVTGSAKLARISPSRTSQGIIAVVRNRETKKNVLRYIKKSQRVVAVDRISDPGNLGTIIRTAAAFEYDLFVSIGDCAEIYNPKTVRATQGSLFNIPIIELDKPAEFIRLFANQFNIVTFSNTARKWLSKASRIKKPALVFGGETSGISPSIESKAEHMFRIEHSDKIDSLNVAVAAGIAMYKFYRGYWK